LRFTGPQETPMGPVVAPRLHPSSGAWSSLTASHRCRIFPILLTQMGNGPSVTCECGAEEQTVDHVVLHCPIHRPTLTKQSNGCSTPASRSSAA